MIEKYEKNGKHWNGAYKNDPLLESVLKRGPIRFLKPSSLVQAKNYLRFFQK